MYLYYYYAIVAANVVFQASVNNKFISLVCQILFSIMLRYVDLNSISLVLKKVS